MKQFLSIIFVSLLAALGFSSCVGCTPGLVYGPAPRPRMDTTAVDTKPVPIETPAPEVHQ